MKLETTVYDGVRKHHFIAAIQIKEGRGYEKKQIAPFSCFAVTKDEFIKKLTKFISNTFEPCEPRGRSTYEYEFVRSTQPRCTEIGVYAYIAVLCG